MSAISTFRHAKPCAIAAIPDTVAALLGHHKFRPNSAGAFASAVAMVTGASPLWIRKPRRRPPPPGPLPITINPHSLIASRIPAARKPYPMDRPTPTSASPRPGRASRFPGRALLGAGAGIGQGSPAVLQVCPDKPLELFEPAGVGNEHVLRHDVEFLRPVDARTDVLNDTAVDQIHRAEMSLALSRPRE